MYSLNGDGSQITGANLYITGDLTTGRTVQAGFGTDALTGCTIGNYNAGQNRTSVTCSGFTQNTATADSFHIVVLNS